MDLPPPRESTFWRHAFPAMYAVIRLLDPLIRPWWRSVGFGLGDIVELRVVGRRSGRYRRVLLTLLHDDGQWILGHPNGDVAWTRNLEAAGTADLAFRRRAAIPVRARRLTGPAHDAAVRATDQQPFPGSVVYRLARSHIRAVGAYFAIDRVG
jgi:deazaflavin-dependent oxidoreductase (nitroreductase family)